MLTQGLLNTIKSYFKDSYVNLEQDSRPKLEN